MLTRRALLDPNLMGIEPDELKLDRTYLYQWFQGFDLAQPLSGSAVPQLNKQDLAPLQFQLPQPNLKSQIAFHRVYDAMLTTRSRIKDSFLN